MLLQMTPVAWNTVRPLNAGFNLKNLPNRSVLIQLANDEEVRVPPPILVNHKDLARLFRHRQNLIQLFGIHCYRLFANDMLASPHRADRDFLVRIIGSRD